MGLRINNRYKSAVRSNNHTSTNRQQSGSHRLPLAAEHFLKSIGLKVLPRNGVKRFSKPRIRRIHN